MNHDIRIQRWGYYVAVVCVSCGDENTAGLLLGKMDGVAGISVGEAAELADQHREQHRRENTEATRVPGQVEFGPGDREATEEPLVAFGPPDEHPEGYHPRTGQRLAPDADSSVVPVELQDRTPLPSTFEQRVDPGFFQEAEHPAKAFLTPGSGGPSLKEYLESKGER